ncbi:MAG: replication initiation protein [Ferrovibrio sp.]|uniref:replication initiation protein n=1 Tax=Ferrovibrio sp. TaxID=1917215 RepID=UPI0026044D52|nr:replication initiation protein [Ferrovibrio sp.]MCW0233201.1 replication initiation protein [Ferrovibrio sp.]
MSALPVLSLSQIPKWTYCANDRLYRDNQRRPREEAVTFKKIAINHTARVNYLIFDCDHDDEYRFRHIGLPAPSWIAATRQTRRHHIVWRLSTPVLTGYDARPKPKWFLAGVAGALREALQADPGYSGLLTKNPLLNGEEDWDVQAWSGKPVTLQEMADRVGFSLGNLKGKPTNDVGTALGRNCQLFDWLRHWAYRNFAHYSNQDHWKVSVLKTAYELNAKFDYPLPHTEVKSTAKSVAKWVWTRYTGSKTILTGLALKSALQRGGIIASIKRKAASDARVQAIYSCLLEAGVQVSISSLAMEAKCNRRVARRVIAALPPEH